MRIIRHNERKHTDRCQVPICGKTQIGAKAAKQLASASISNNTGIMNEEKHSATDS